MTLVLALDTATLTASVAVVRDGAILVEASTDTGSTGSHSERLMPLVAELMDGAGVSVAERAASLTETDGAAAPPRHV